MQIFYVFLTLFKSDCISVFYEVNKHTLNFISVINWLFCPLLSSFSILIITDYLWWSENIFVKYQKKCAINKKRFHNMVVYLQCASIMYNRFLSSEGPNSYNISQFFLKITFIYFLTSFRKKKEKSISFSLGLNFYLERKTQIYWSIYLCSWNTTPLFLPYSV